MILKIWCPPTLRTHIQLLSYISKSLKPNGNPIFSLISVLLCECPTSSQCWALEGSFGTYLSLIHQSYLNRPLFLTPPIQAFLDYSLQSLKSEFILVLLYLKQFSVFSLHIGSWWKSRVWPGGHVGLGSSHSPAFSSHSLLTTTLLEFQQLHLPQSSRLGVSCPHLGVSLSRRLPTTGLFHL